MNLWLIRAAAFWIQVVYRKRFDLQSVQKWLLAYLFVKLWMTTNASSSLAVNGIRRTEAIQKHFNSIPIIKIVVQSRWIIEIYIWTEKRVFVFALQRQLGSKMVSCGGYRCGILWWPIETVWYEGHQTRDTQSLHRILLSKANKANGVSSCYRKLGLWSFQWWPRSERQACLSKLQTIFSCISIFLAIIQLMAASQTVRPMIYTAFGDKKLIESFAAIYDYLLAERVQVRDLYRYLKRFCETPEKTTLFEFIRKTPVEALRQWTIFRCFNYFWWNIGQIKNLIL